MTRSKPLHQSHGINLWYVTSEKDVNGSTNSANSYQEAQLSQRDRAMLRAIKYFAKSLTLIPWVAAGGVSLYYFLIVTMCLVSTVMR